MREHLDRVLKEMGPDDSDAAGSMLSYLVTPSGSKIAQEPSALARWTKQPEDRVRTVLDHFQKGRILRPVEGADRAEKAYGASSTTCSRRSSWIRSPSWRSNAPRKKPARRPRHRRPGIKRISIAPRRRPARRPRRSMAAEAAARREAKFSQRSWIAAGFTAVAALFVLLLRVASGEGEGRGEYGC